MGFIRMLLFALIAVCTIESSHANATLQDGV